MPSETERKMMFEDLVESGMSRECIALDAIAAPTESMNLYIYIIYILLKSFVFSSLSFSLSPSFQVLLAYYLFVSLQPYIYTLSTR